MLLKYEETEMRKYLISNEGKFYKANLHSHSNISDGALTPLEMKELYKANGYSVIAYTDHDVMIPHPELSDGEFLALTGFEMEINEADTYPNTKWGKTCHLCFIAPSPDTVVQPCFNPRYAYIGSAGKYHDVIVKDKATEGYERHYTAENINEMMRICREAGFFITYNHPGWSLEDYPIYTSYHGMHAMEIYNHSSAHMGYDDYNESKYDDILRHGERIYAVAADDNHNKADDACGGFVMIKAKSLEYKAITDALFAGEFYASQGPEIKEIYVEDGRLFVTTSDAQRITVVTGVRRAASAHARDGVPVNSISFAVEDYMKYVRVVVTDMNGKEAYSRAYFVDEIV